MRKEKRGFLALPIKNSPWRVIFYQRIFQSRQKPAKTEKRVLFAFLSLSLSFVWSSSLSPEAVTRTGLIQPRNLQREIAKAGHKEVRATSTDTRKRRLYLLVSVMLAAETQRADRRMDWSWHEMHRECIMHTAFSLLSHRSLLSPGYNEPHVPEDVQTHSRDTSQSLILMRIVTYSVGWDPGEPLKRTAFWR